MRMADDDRVVWNGDIDADAVERSLPGVPGRALDEHPAAQDVRAESFEAGGERAGPCAQRLGRAHLAKADLQGKGHYRFPDP